MLAASEFAVNWVFSPFVWNEFESKTSKAHQNNFNLGKNKELQ